MGFIVTALMSTCDKLCNIPDHYCVIENLQVVLCEDERGIPERRAVSVEGFQLRMTFDLVQGEYIYASNGIGFFPAAYAVSDCFSINKGLQDDISSVSLVCDTSIGGFAAGEDLIADFYYKAYRDVEYSWKPGEWIKLLNYGYDHTYRMSLWGTDYEFFITTLLSGPEVEVEEDDYTFTFRLDYTSGENSFSVTFPPVWLK